jgi:hypothetical protein
MAEPIEALSPDNVSVADTPVYGASYAIQDELSAVVASIGDSIWRLQDPGPVLVGSSSLQVVINQILSDEFNLSPRARFLILAMLEDSIDLVDSPAELIKRVFAVAEAVRVIEGLSPQLVTNTELEDGVSASTLIRTLFSFVGLENADFTDEVPIAVRRVFSSLENVRLSDSISTASSLLLELAESISASDQVAFGFAFFADELVDIAALSDYGMAIITNALEALAVGDTVAFNAILGLTPSESLSLTEALRWVAAAAALDALDIVDTADFTVSQLLRCIEGLVAVTPTSVAVQLLASLSDTVSATSILNFLATFPAEELVDLADEAPLDFSNLAFAFETFQASVSVTTAVQFLQALVEAPIIGDAIRIRFGFSMEEAVDLVDTLEGDILRLLHAIESILLVTPTGYEAVLNLNLSDSVLATDFVRSLFLATAEENLDLTEDTIAVLANFFAAVEGVGVKDLAPMQMQYFEDLAEGATLRVLLAAFDEIIAIDSLEVTEAVEPYIRVLVGALSTIRALDSALASLLLEAGLNEAIAIGELLRITLSMISEDAISVTEETDIALVHVLAALSRLSVVTPTSTTVSLAAMLMEQVLSLDLATVVQGMTAEEIVELTDAITNAIRAQLTSSDSLAIADEAQRSFFVVSRLDDNVAFSDSMPATLRAWLHAQEGIAFVGLLPLEDGEYQAWAINTDSLGVTQYSNFPFDDLETHNGSTYGLTETGLYELVGDTDDGVPIDALIRTGMLTFGSTNLKRVARAFLYITQNDKIYLKVTAEQRGRRDCTTYEISPLEQYDAQLRRVKLGREVRGTSWSFEIGNVDGGSIDLEGAEVLPMVLAKRW